VKSLTADHALAAAARCHSLARPGSSVEAIAAQLVGLHNTSPVSPYLSLRTRLPGFERTDLDRLMWQEWRLARVRAMRLTMFVLPHDLLEVTAAATRHLAEPFAQRWLRDSELTAPEFDRLAAQVLGALADGPLTVRGLRRTLRVPQSVDLPGIVGRMCDMGWLVGGAPPRSWRSSVREYHRWQDVLPDVDLLRWNEGAAIRELTRCYIVSYGPVTIDDLSWWTGFTKGRCRTALESLGDTVEAVVVDDWPGPLYRATGQNDGADLGTGVHALPLLDPYVQGYRDRSRFLPPGRHDYVYDGGGNAAATLVHRGRIIGVWQPTERPEPSVSYHLFSRSPASVQREAETDLAAVGAMYFDRAVDVVRVAEMVPLSAGGGRSAAHPLDGVVHRASRRRSSRS
jgi:hypothetical protein